MPLDITPVDTLNVADSARVAIANVANALITDPNQFFQELLRDGIAFALKVVAALVIYTIGAWLIKRVKGMLRRIFERRHTEGTLATFINSLVSISLTILLVLITISTLGVNTTSIAAVLAAGGMAIGMALSGTVQNFAGGIMILIFRPFKTGDYIEALGYFGKVSEVNIVSTKLRTFDNKTIILPNGALSNGNIQNYFEHEVNRLEWLVTLEYGVDNAKAKESMMEILKNDPRILNSTTPGAANPFVGLNAMKDSYVEYTMKAWVKASDYWDVKYDVNEKIYTSLPEKGLNFAFPQLDVHIRN